MRHHEFPTPPASDAPSPRAPGAGGGPLRPGRRALLAGGLAASAWPWRAMGQAAAFPSRPVRIVCPLPPGSPSDVLARALVEPLQANFGQPVIVDNRPGATGAIGLEVLAKSPPDGHTVGILFMTHTVLPTLFGKVGYDIERDLAPVTNLAWAYNVLVVPASSPVTTLPELVRAAKARPGALNYASGGNGSPAHMVAEFFKQRTDLRIVHVPYKGPADAVQGLLGGQVDMMFATTSAAVPLIKAGKLRPIVVTSPERLGALPEVPTMREAGVDGWDVREWQGIAAPAGTPADVLARWNAALSSAMSDASMRDRLASLGMAPAAANSAQAFGSLVHAELGRWSTLVRQLNLKVD